MAFKVCDGCKFKNPARVRKCKQCDAAFAFKVKRKKEKKQKISDWKELIPGDYIKVAGGSIFIDKEENEIPMGYNGIFVVISLDKNGIMAHGKDKSSGFCHIWMNKEQLSPSGIIRRPHKIYKLNVG